VLLTHDVLALEHAFSHHEGYLPHGAALHAVDRTLEYSRPLRALKLWLAFTVHGAEAIRAAIARNLEEAALLATLLEDDPRFEVLGEPTLSAVCFRHRASDNAALAEAIAADGRMLLAPAEVDGATWLRACFVNHRTTEEDVRVVPELVAEVAEGLR
jgi:aromatic-L-amino-acid decarboxylase